MRITKGISASLIEAISWIYAGQWRTLAEAHSRKIQLVRGLILLTDSQLANRLDVDERTIRKWKSGETSMVFTTWCCLCWLADWVCRSITLSVAEDSLPDAS
jgi:DNA-binding XRE family transcriptional regulator